MDFEYHCSGKISISSKTDVLVCTVMHSADFIDINRNIVFPEQCYSDLLDRGRAVA